MEGSLCDLGRIALDTLFPRFCLRCKKEGSFWCVNCDENYVVFNTKTKCPFCKKPHMSSVCDDCSAFVYLDGVFSIASYSNPIVREAITTWKYHGDQVLGQTITRWIRKACNHVEMLEGDYEITSISLHTSRFRARGFNQAEHIAKAVAGSFCKQPIDLLERIKKTGPRAKIESSQRRVGDLDGVFKVKSVVPDQVVLCDDVFTSGATLDAAAKVLKEAGARKVWGFVLATG
ncbi:MAG: hypothetical protein ABIH21_04630 [Patescibacteria group bacterium]